MTIEQAIRDEVRAAIAAELPALPQQWLERQPQQPPAEPKLISRAELCRLLGIEYRSLTKFLTTESSFPHPVPLRGVKRERWDRIAVERWISHRSF